MVLCALFLYRSPMLLSSTSENILVVESRDRSSEAFQAEILLYFPVRARHLEYRYVDWNTYLGRYVTLRLHRCSSA
eukprot:scaffold53016_cov60-Attheya_sp.AAC.5